MANVPPAGGRKHPEQKYIPIDTKNILFVCGGTFVGLKDIIARRVGKRSMGFGTTTHTKTNSEEYNDLMQQVTTEDLVEFGMIPEFLGRLPVIATLNELGEAELIRILTEPKNSLTRQYQKLVDLVNGSKLDFTPDALKRIVAHAIKRDTGARGLRGVMEEFMEDIIYLLPEYESNTYLIDADVVDKKKTVFNTKQAA